MADHPPFIDALEQRSLLPDDCLAVLLVGSAARGWNNARSDYDLYVISNQRWTGAERDTVRLPLDPPVIGTESFYADGRRWEVTYWLDSQVDQMLAKVSWREFELGRAAGLALVGHEQAFLERLANSVPLVGEAWLATRRRELSESAFRSLAIARSLGAADGAVEDALGQMESGHLDSAVLSARKALGHAVDALLEQYGQYESYSPKWRPHRFRAAQPAELSFEDYWRLETMQTFDPSHPEPWINEILTLCQDISLKVEV
jgi:predicted nucleotidyltransferase